MARKVYTEEFKKAAIDQVIVQRHNASSVAKRLGVGYDTLRKWVERAKFGSAKSLVPADLPADERVRELEKENVRLRMERVILKKATAYFATEHL